MPTSTPSRIALVTGGTRGIGRAISERLLADGMGVTAIYGANEEAAEEFRAATGALAIRCDVADFPACARAVARIEAEVGPIDVLVNNAGVTRDGMAHKLGEDDWRAVLGTNLDSMFNMSRQVLDGMRARGFGRIVNISSINGQKGQVGQANYAAAKAGVIGLTKSLALEGAAKGVTVNAVAPGYIETAMTAKMPPEVLGRIVAGIPVGRMGRPDEVARCVSFLASEEAGFITGATLAVNGGQYLSG
ncbi:MAG: acetoacetyl-CoA reductase [Caulobacteraceae bacterium]|nr:acetoacetyl-CoA reductase [Caulobacteraceae bacterium]